MSYLDDVKLLELFQHPQVQSGLERMQEDALDALDNAVESNDGMIRKVSELLAVRRLRRKIASAANSAKLNVDRSGDGV